MCQPCRGDPLQSFTVNAPVAGFAALSNLWYACAPAPFQQLTLSVSGQTLHASMFPSLPMKLGLDAIMPAGMLWLTLFRMTWNASRDCHSMRSNSAAQGQATSPFGGGPSLMLEFKNQKVGHKPCCLVAP